jgi:hypothetical protein
VDGLELCVARLADSLEPPRQTVSERVDQNRRLSSEASAERGEWRTDRAPYQRAIMSGMPPLFLGIKVNEVAGEAAPCEVRDVAELIGCREVGSGHPAEPRGRSDVRSPRAIECSGVDFRWRDRQHQSDIAQAPAGDSYAAPGAGAHRLHF